jgi:predicted adenine nucleotide alpha hydrolase (AANH) superfamily ATPase
MAASTDWSKNAQKWLDELLASIGSPTRRLLLHSCCAPCSSYVLEYLSAYFRVTLFYYNPNITSAEEYRHRLEEQRRFIESMPLASQISFMEGRYDPEHYLTLVKGYEQEREGGKRCLLCYGMRLREAAEAAKEGGFDYFTTTLSISPLKNSKVLNDIGNQLAKEYGVNYLYSDFKKHGGYQRSIELSREYGLYRQNYCGCEFSKQ